MCARARGSLAMTRILKHDAGLSDNRPRRKVNDAHQAQDVPLGARGTRARPARLGEQVRDLSTSGAANLVPPLHGARRYVRRPARFSAAGDRQAPPFRTMVGTTAKLAIDRMRSFVPDYLVNLGHRREVTENARQRDDLRIGPTGTQPTPAPVEADAPARLRKSAPDQFTTQRVHQLNSSGVYRLPKTPHKCAWPWPRLYGCLSVGSSGGARQHLLIDHPCNSPDDITRSLRSG